MAKKSDHGVTNLARFQRLNDGSHKHHVASVRHQKESFSSMRQLKEQQEVQLKSQWLKRLWAKEIKSNGKQKLADTGNTLARRYSESGQVLGSGAFGTVRLAHKFDDKISNNEQVYAVKEHKQHLDESLGKYRRRVTAEFRILSSLHHQSVVIAFELLQNANNVYYQVMEYCSGEDLGTIIASAGHLEEEEADCFFKQIMFAVEYIHEMGIAHRDLKPENILLTSQGAVKITDFGSAECFRTAEEIKARMSSSVRGTTAYIAPEVFAGKEFDPCAVDVWACGVVYLAMRMGQYLWRVARAGEDAAFERYTEDRKSEVGYKPIERLRRVRQP
ncbi:hypothetical protein B5807_07577 [Epicoccum nigrum]|uniref:Protein kinase domain-containing protein n=1 Tax=Epicoccum nigrum TaxID=105696 RepID=A0A1Y2LTY2_EPING|nr:hypothetical protein B5807_07577 [Epicoccum nigrum]